MVSGATEWPCLLILSAAAVHLQARHVRLAGSGERLRVEAAVRIRTPGEFLEQGAVEPLHHRAVELGRPAVGGVVRDGFAQQDVRDLQRTGGMQQGQQLQAAADCPLRRM